MEICVIFYDIEHCWPIYIKKGTYISSNYGKKVQKPIEHICPKKLEIFGREKVRPFPRIPGSH
jgi:hypothetical protein